MSLYTHIYIAHMVLEADSALAIGSGNEGIYADETVRLDFNGLPTIPWTAIKGALSHIIEKDEKLADPKDVLGYTNGGENNDKNKGASFMGSDALLVDSAGQVLTQLQDPFKDAVYKHYRYLPVREHTAINEMGSAKTGSKFSNQIVYKGSRFKLEVKLELQKEDETQFKKFLNLFAHHEFRLGAQTTNGLGKMKVVSCHYKHFDLTEAEGLEEYANYSPDLNIQFKGESFTIENGDKTTAENLGFSFSTDAIHIGSGYGDERADSANLIEGVVKWDEYKFVEMENHFVIPGSAVKGALHHRTFYHWCEPFDIENAGNRDIKDYYKEAEKKFNELGLFGNETTTNDENETKEGMGQVLVEDVYVSYSKDNETTFMHNAIDRFTQGVMQGALYSENVIAIDKAKLSIQLLVNQESICEELEKVVHAFKKAIEELKNGSLPIGGNTTNGNGFLNEL